MTERVASSIEEQEYDPYVPSDDELLGEHEIRTGHNKKTGKGKSRYLLKHGGNSPGLMPEQMFIHRP